MTTPLNRDEIVEVMARDMEKTLSYEVERDVLACDLTREEQRKVASAALRALEAAGCQIVQGEPVAWRYDGPTVLILWGRQPDRVADGWTETPLFAGKVQP